MSTTLDELIIRARIDALTVELTRCNLGEVDQLQAKLHELRWVLGDEEEPPLLRWEKSAKV